GCPANDPAFRRALTFVERCQNYALDSADEKQHGDDGGFFFIYDDAIRNKAGLLDTRGAGRTRFASYGSTSADGLRALLLCGLTPEHGRVQAARTWLRNSFSATEQPGKFTPERALGRPALYYYYCWSVAHALQAAEGRELPTPTGNVRWFE